MPLRRHSHTFGTSHVEVSGSRARAVEARSTFLIKDITRKRYSVGLADSAARDIVAS